MNKQDWVSWWNVTGCVGVRAKAGPGWWLWERKKNQRDLLTGLWGLREGAYKVAAPPAEVETPEGEAGVRQEEAWLWIVCGRGAVDGAPTGQESDPGPSAAKGLHVRREECSKAAESRSWQLLNRGMVRGHPCTVLGTDGFENVQGADAKVQEREASGFGRKQFWGLWSQGAGAWLMKVERVGGHGEEAQVQGWHCRDL